MIADAIGVLGTVMILATYFLLQAGRIDAQKVAYSALNGLGALLVLMSLWFKFNLAAFALEVAWCAISIWGLFRALSRRESAGSERLSG